MKICQTPNCKNSVKKGCFCWTCISRKRRKKNPLRYAFETLRSNAKCRGKEFKITFNEFKQFAIKSQYIQNKGITKESYHIDRIDEDGPYSIDNIQVLCNSENVKKYIAFKERNPDGSIVFTTNKENLRIKHDAPF